MFWLSIYFMCIILSFFCILYPIIVSTSTHFQNSQCIHMLWTYELRTYSCIAIEYEKQSMTKFERKVNKTIKFFFFIFHFSAMEICGRQVRWIKVIESQSTALINDKHARVWWAGNSVLCRCLFAISQLRYWLKISIDFKYMSGSRLSMFEFSLSWESLFYFL